jgi:hypothetical protein
MRKKLRALAGVGSLLSRHNSNPKIAKAEKLLGVRTAVLHLAPGNMSGIEVCPSRSPGCTAACLHFAGAPIHQNQKDRTRIARTHFLFRHKDLFFDLMKLELVSHVKAADKAGLRPAVRLNGTSDLPWERLKGDDGILMEQFPDVQFYDYTAIINRLRAPLPPNYHLTFSVKEDNLAETLEAIERGFNVAAVFPSDDIPDRFLGLPVIDGDEHDYRPADPPGSVIGLKYKGHKAVTDRSGFVIRGEADERLAA